MSINEPNSEQEVSMRDTIIDSDLAEWKKVLAIMFMTLRELDYLLNGTS